MKLKKELNMPTAELEAQIKEVESIRMFGDGEKIDEEDEGYKTC